MVYMTYRAKGTRLCMVVWGLLQRLQYTHDKIDDSMCIPCRQGRTAASSGLISLSQHCVCIDQRLSGVQMFLKLFVIGIMSLIVIRVHDQAYPHHVHSAGVRHTHTGKGELCIPRH